MYKRVQSPNEKEKERPAAYSRFNEPANEIPHGFSRHQKTVLDVIKSHTSPAGVELSSILQQLRGSVPDKDVRLRRTVDLFRSDFRLVLICV